jgi:putative N6-adenine-specific DNA methylase
VSAIPFEEMIPPDGNFIVDATSVRSKLHATPSIQSVTEKAVADRLTSSLGMKKGERLAKTGAKYRLRMVLHKDEALLLLDTSGAGLHKRGYRTETVEAPIKETLAAAMVLLSFWRKDRALLDPFCGSGTILIEAAMIERGIAPGLDRHFASEDWGIMPAEKWKAARKAAYGKIGYGFDLDIRGSDISGEAVEAARKNADNAGVGEDIVFEAGDFTKIEKSSIAPYSIIITNPPYGERIGNEALATKLNTAFHNVMTNKTLSLYVITTDDDFETDAVKRPADRRRKLYNGRLKTTYYQYYGKRPPR